MLGTCELRAVSLSRIRKGRYTFSVKLSDFTVWRHTWRKNWVNCAVLKGNSAGLRTVLSAVFHTQNCALNSGNPSVSSVYLPTPQWHHLKALKLTKWLKERRPLRSLKRTDRYLNLGTQKIGSIATESIRQRYWHHCDTHNKKPRTDKKTDKPTGKPVLRRRTFSSVFRAVFYTVKLRSLIKVFHSPTDAHVNCLKNNFKIYIKIYF
jgi:hypothetical protein